MHLRAPAKDATIYKTLAVVAVLAYVATRKLIEEVLPLLLKVGIAGKDINKPFKEELVPEAAGLATVLVFSAGVSLFSFLLPIPQLWMALFSISSSAFLGLVDNIINLKWRYKLIIPLFTLLPVAMCYNGKGIKLLGFQVPAALVRVYLMTFAIFAQNAVNIYAGVNSLEVGQSLVAVVFLLFAVSVKNTDPTEEFKWKKAPEEVVPLPCEEQDQWESTLAAIVVGALFLSTSLALFHFNLYPAQAFVGDVYTYFAGTTFAVCAVLGDMPVMAPLLYAPQILNFLISVPQLFGFVPCPRHRLPRYSSSSKMLVGRPSNLNLINQYLVLRGPTSEKSLGRELMAFQWVVDVIILAFYFLVKNADSFDPQQRTTRTRTDRKNKGKAD